MAITAKYILTCDEVRQEAMGIPVKLNVDSGMKPNGVPERK